MDTPAASQDSPPSSPLSKVGWIGIRFQDHNGHGVGVTAVFPGGPAAAAGVRVGDILVRIGGTDLASAQGAEAAIERLVPQHPTSLTIERGSQTTESKVIPESMADFRQDYIGEMLRRDPRDSKYALHHGMSDADISAEVVRRLFDRDRPGRFLSDEAHC